MSIATLDYMLAARSATDCHTGPGPSLAALTALLIRGLVLVAAIHAAHRLLLVGAQLLQRGGGRVRLGGG